MSTLERRMAGRRNAAKQAERRKRLILVGLMIVLAAVLAFQLPKLMKGSGSSSATSTPSTTTTAAPTATSGARALTATKASVSAKRIRAIHGMAAKDLFVPLVHDNTSTGSEASSPPASSAPVPAASSATAAPASTVSAASKPAHVKPAHVKPAVPTAAVIWTNGARQVVGLSQVFNVGETQFKLVAVTRDTVRIAVLGGAFAGRGQAITVHKGHHVQLANTATGVRYGLLFTQAGIAANSK